MIHRAAWMILCLAPLLAACSAIPQRAKQQETQQQFMTYAGAPVERFSYLGQYNDWRALSSAQLAVWTSINDAYLVTVREPCIHLQFTGRIGPRQVAFTVAGNV